MAHLISISFLFIVLSSVAHSPLNCNQEVKAAKPETAHRSLCLDHDPSNNSILTEFLSLASRMSTSRRPRSEERHVGLEVKQNQCLLRDVNLAVKVAEICWRSTMMNHFVNNRLHAVVHSV